MNGLGSYFSAKNHGRGGVWSPSLGIPGNHGRLVSPLLVSSSALVMVPCYIVSHSDGVVNIHEVLRTILRRNPVTRGSLGF